MLRGPLGHEVRALMAAPGRDIVATGSTQLVRAPIAAGLVDEHRLFVFRSWRRDRSSRAAVRLRYAATIRP